MKSRPPKILLVQLPLSSPSAPSWMVLFLASSLSSKDFTLSFFDANLDVFFSKRSKNPQEPDDHRFRALCTDAFYIPEKLVLAIGSLRKTADRFSNTEDSHAYLCDQLALEINSENPDFLILTADSDRQFQTGHQLLRWARSFRKGLPACLICGSDVNICGKIDGEGIVRIEDSISFLKGFLDIGEALTSRPACFPDLNLFPWERYAAPIPVLDLKIFSTIFSENTLRFEQTSRSGMAGILLFESESPEIPKTVFDAEKISLSLGLGLRLPLTPDIPAGTFPDYYRRGVKLILWRRPSGSLKNIERILYSSAAAGIWNQLSLPDPRDPSDPLLTFAQTHPNLVHSWSGSRSESFLSDDRLMNTEPTAYDRISPVPGTPFCRFLSDPVHLLLYLLRFDASKIQRWRVKEEGSVYSIGGNIAYRFVKPDELPPGHFDIICKMVDAGGSVNPQWVRTNLKNAFLIGIAEEEGTIVGNSSLKHPRKEYLKKLSQKTAFDLTDYLERGYTSVRPEYRGLGIGTKLLEGLTARIGKRKLFSIIGEDNTATQKMAIRNRTRKVGSFFSKKAGKRVGIWIPEWMLDD